MCDTILIADGQRVLFAKNSDRDPNEAQGLEWHPRRRSSGAGLKCTWIRVPETDWTHAIAISRPFWMWGAEMGTNEHGVTIGNEAVFTTEPNSATGLTGMDLVRLALERAETAEAAVDVITSLLEQHGQGGACGFEYQSLTYHNSFAIADASGAFILETAGRKWQAERVDGARTISNGLTIPDFARAHQHEFKTRIAHARVRRSRTQALADDATSPADLMAILRDHGAAHALPEYRWFNGAAAAPCMHAGGLVSLGSQTTGSWVSELSASGHRHWATGTAAPCTSLFKPVDVHEPMDLGGPAGANADARSLWWRHERFHRRVMRDLQDLAPVFQQERDQTEAEWLSKPVSSAEAFAEGDELLVRWQQAIAARADRDLRPWLTRRFWSRRNATANLSSRK